MIKKRLDYIDVSKGIAIFLVVFGHICLQSDITIYVYAFHIPVFFFVSGLFFKKQDVNMIDFAVKKAKMLLLPYVSLYIISYLYWILAESTFVGFEYKPLIGLFYATDNGYMYPNGALWFLPALFVTEIVFFYFLKFSDSVLKLIVLLVLSAVVGSILSYSEAFRLPFGINSTFMAIFFLGSGYLFKEFLHIVTDMNRLKSIFFSVSSFVLMVLFARMNDKVDMDYVFYGNPFIFILAALSGVSAMLFLSQAIGNNRLLSFLGRNSLLIMGFQFPVLRGVLKVYALLIDQDEMILRSSFAHSTACSVITIVLTIPLILLFNKYLFFLLGKSRVSG